MRAPIVTGLPQGLESLRETHVWYVCYGSNLLCERFMLYVAGGECPYNGSSYPGCDDPTPPALDVPFDIPYDIYFGNERSAWGEGGVAFLDPSAPGFSYGRAYLVTRGQYEQVRDQEGRGSAWYCDELDLGDLHGISAVTFTNFSPRPRRAPSASYLDVLVRGLRETRPDLSDEEVRRYFDAAQGR